MSDGGRLTERGRKEEEAEQDKRRTPDLQLQILRNHAWTIGLISGSGGKINNLIDKHFVVRFPCYIILTIPMFSNPIIRIPITTRNGTCWSCVCGTSTPAPHCIQRGPGRSSIMPCRGRKDQPGYSENFREKTSSRQLRQQNATEYWMRLTNE